MPLLKVSESLVLKSNCCILSFSGSYISSKFLSCIYCLPIFICGLPHIVAVVCAVLILAAVVGDDMLGAVYATLVDATGLLPLENVHLL